jgi:hypothetical protein
VIAPAVVGVAEHVGVPGNVVRPLDPGLWLQLELVWRAPARTAVRRLVSFLLEAATDPEALIHAPAVRPQSIPHPARR